MRMEQGVRTGLGHGGITYVLQTQFSSFFCFFFKFFLLFPFVLGHSEQINMLLLYFLPHRSIGRGARTLKEESGGD